MNNTKSFPHPKIGSCFTRNSYGLKFWTLRGANVCGIDSEGNYDSGGTEKCVADNTIITTQGFDGQFTSIDFENNLNQEIEDLSQETENLVTEIEKWQM